MIKKRSSAVKEPGGGIGIGLPAVSSGQTNDASETHGRNARAARRLEISRFKGLDEISPKEFAQFIGKEMRLSKVEYAHEARSRADSEFLHGKEHAGAEGLHHGQACRTRGGVRCPLPNMERRASFSLP